VSCLGERLTALVDGELGDEERERAHAHLAGCDGCREEADQLRKLKGRLRGLSELPATDGTDDLPSPDFLSRLRTRGDCIVSGAYVQNAILCPLPVCGNGTREALEQCDDGNTISGDGCSSACQVEGSPP